MDVFIDFIFANTKVRFVIYKDKYLEWAISDHVFTGCCQCVYRYKCMQVSCKQALFNMKYGKSMPLHLTRSYAKNFTESSGEIIRAAKTDPETDFRHV